MKEELKDNKVFDNVKIIKDKIEKYIERNSTHVYQIQRYTKILNLLDMGIKYRTMEEIGEAKTTKRLKI